MGQNFFVKQWRNSMSYRFTKNHKCKFFFHIICHICRTMVCSFATMAMRSNNFSSLLVGKVAQKTMVPGTQLLASTETSVLTDI